MKYELAYYDENLNPTNVATDTFAIYIRSDNGLQIRCYYEYVSSKGRFLKSNWFDYNAGFYGLVPISEEEVFTLCL